jgi:pyruvate carboxylase
MIIEKNSLVNRDKYFSSTNKNQQTMEQLENLKKLVASLEEDGAKFYNKGNNSAGTRLRKTLQAIRVEAQNLRNSIQEAKKADSGS